MSNTITSQKSLKIASLNGLIKSLVEMIDIPVAIVNLNGEIIETSKKIKSEIDYNKDLNIADIIPQIDIRKAFKEASLTHLPVKQEDNILIPFFSTIGDIAYFLVDILNIGFLLNL